MRFVIKFTIAENDNSTNINTLFIKEIDAFR